MFVLHQKKKKIERTWVLVLQQKQIERNYYACVLEVAEGIPEPHRFGLRGVCRVNLWQAQRVHGKLIRFLFLLDVVEMNGSPQIALRVVKRQRVRVVSDFVDDLVRSPANLVPHDVVLHLVEERRVMA